MLRRNLLQLLGGLTVGALSSPLLAKAVAANATNATDVLTETARRFAAARKTQRFSRSDALFSALAQLEAKDRGQGPLDQAGV